MSDRVKTAASVVGAVAACVALALGGIYAKHAIDSSFSEPAPAPSIDPQMWVIFDVGGDRVESSDIEAIAGRVPLGTYKLLGVPKPGQKLIKRVVIVADEGTPTPAPPLPPEPQPEPKPDDLTPKPLKVALIYESANGVPEQFAVPEVEEYLNAHCGIGYDGRREWRCIDPDVEFTKSGESEAWKPMLAGKRDSLPWIELRAGSRSFSGPCPDDLLALLKKYGG